MFVYICVCVCVCVCMDLEYSSKILLPQLRTCMYALYTLIHEPDIITLLLPTPGGRVFVSCSQCVCEWLT